MPGCRNAVKVFFSIILYVVFIIIHFVCIQFSVFLHTLFYAICKVSLFHILILQLPLLCRVKVANIGQTVYRIFPNSEYFRLERLGSAGQTYN